MRRYRVHFSHAPTVWTFDSLPNAEKRAFYQSGKHQHDITFVTDQLTNTVVLRIVGISTIEATHA